MDRNTRTLTIALAASLALNLFCVGFVLGRRSGWFHGGAHGRPRPHAAGEHAGPGREHARHGTPRGRDLGPHGFLRRAGLHDAGPEVAKVLEGRREALRAQRAEVRDAREQVGQALAAEPFDAAGLARALSALQAASASAQGEMHAALVEVAKTLSVAQRKRLADTPWLSPDRPGPMR